MKQEQLCISAPAAHADPIWPELAPAADNHSSDELFSLEIIHLNMVIKPLEEGRRPLIKGSNR